MIKRTRHFALLPRLVNFMALLACFDHAPHIIVVLVWQQGHHHCRGTVAPSSTAFVIVISPSYVISHCGAALPLLP